MDEAEIITDAPSALESMSYKPSPSFRFLLSLAEHWQYGTAHVVLPNGERLTFKGPEPGPEATLVVHRDRFARRSIVGGQLGFCEGYLDGDWSSPDAARWMELFLRNEHHMEEVLVGQTWARFLMKIPHLFRRNSRGGSKKNISQHYDLGIAHLLALVQAAAAACDAVVALPDSITNPNRERIAAWAMAQRVPSASGWAMFAQSGMLMTYGPNLRDCFRRVGYFAARVLGGTRTTDLPIEQPTRFELVLNLRTAKAIGLSLAEAHLARADEVLD